ncbi:cell surface receptor/MFS transporter [Geopyxis carbonaria]|nr:cell surface receptor/MFS transporter [Geopyxis carbonaria]
MSPLSRSSSEKLKAPHVSLDEFPTASSTGPSTGPSYAGASSVSPGDPPQYRVYRRRFLGLFMLILLNIMVSWAWLTFSPVVSLAAAHYRVSESAINWLSTSILFAYVVATPAVIYSLHRFSTKPTLLAACLLLLAGNWIRYAGARAASFPVTMVGQLLIGAAQPFVLSAPPHYSDAWFTPAGRISATAAASLANPVGAALGQLINPMWATAPEDIPDMVLWVAVITTVGVLGWVLVPTRPPTPPCASAAPHPTPTPRAAVAALLANREWIALTAMFWIYLGGFNALSTLLPQIMIPRGYTLDTAGLTGALLIVVGLIAAAVIAPIVDRTHAFTTAIRTLVPITAATYVAFIWAPHEGALAPPFVVAAVMGAGSFALLPVALEWAGEITYPVPTEWASGVMWAGGQLVGGVLIVGMDAMKGLDPPLACLYWMRVVRLRAVGSLGVHCTRTVTDCSKVRFLRETVSALSSILEYYQ